MRKLHKLLLILSTLTLTVFISFQSIFTLQSDPKLQSFGAMQEDVSLHCLQGSFEAPLDVERQIDVLVWNIYKQNRETLLSELSQLSTGKQLVLLQEASMTPELQNWIETSGWFGNQAEAFKAFDTASGVLNLSIDQPKIACAYTELEPWLQLPKSAIYARYPLSTGQELAVVNIHAVNFTYGVLEYQRQIDTLVKELTQHQGPIIIAGDFKSWSEERLQVMNKALDEIEVKAAQYMPDNRTQFITGLPLDHVYYRGLELITAEAPISDASDHNPIIASFKL